jgi:hypothetical protein
LKNTPDIWTSELQSLTTYSELELIEISEKLKSKCQEHLHVTHEIASTQDKIASKNKENITSPMVVSSTKRFASNMT